MVKLIVFFILLFLVALVIIGMVAWRRRPVARKEDQQPTAIAPQVMDKFWSNALNDMPEHLRKEFDR